MTAITLTTCQAPNCDIVVRELAEYLSHRLPDQVTLDIDRPWQERARLLDEGHIDVGWICSLPYVLRTDDGTAAYQLLAAPVRAVARYNDKPVYFSDIVVSRRSHYQSFADLRGARWAYNEPLSLSGYTVVRAHLADMGETRFFGEVVEAGSHERALEMVRSGEADGAAIDSTVLERQAQIAPESVIGLRVVASLGPNPAPPLVVRKGMEQQARRRLSEALLNMHLNAEGFAHLESAQLARFAPVQDSDYDATRAANARASSVTW